VPDFAAYADLQAASLVRDKAAWLFDAGWSCRLEVNMAKLLASQAAWRAANACMDAHGGYGFDKSYDCRAQVPRGPPLYDGACQQLACPYAVSP
jgi:alkylation response protein AidB-like acyl-CoA dehydrogenase